MSVKLTLTGIVVRRGETEILRIPALDVNEGEVLALLGPNGAGKSTLLQVLALLDRPAEGEVRFDGAPAAGRELALRRRMAVVFQDSLLLNRSVEANVGLGLALRHVPGPERDGRVRRWMARFGIETLARRSARSLSGGEAQRAALARAFALEPEVLLLDEPFSALDQPTREALQDELLNVLRETAITTVFVTHDRDEAGRLAGRVAVLVGGRLRQIGPVAEVFGAPADETVAAYVGVETVVPARVLSACQGLVTLQAGSARVEAAAEGFSGREALLCLRPEDVVLAPGDAPAPDSARNHLRGTVRRIIATGSQARVEVDCGFPLVAAITRRSLDELALAAGTPVLASFKATAVHLIPRGATREP